MRNLWPIALLFVLLRIPLFAQTQEFPDTSGNAFLRLCSPGEKDYEHITQTEIGNTLVCFGYVRGFTSGVEVEKVFAEAKTSRKVPAPFCLPNDVESGQTVRIVLKYIRNNPEEAHRPTDALILAALGKAYPCPSK